VSLYFNLYRRSFHIPNTLSAILLNGYKGRGLHRGNGDCLLLDGLQRLIGVADGTERSPQVSRRFLQCLSDRFQAGPPGSDYERRAFLLETTQSVLDQFSYEDRTTFLCVLPEEDGSLYYVSGGDSLLLHINNARTQISLCNHPNMAFVGRSRDIPDYGHIKAQKGDLFLLATDGLWDLHRREDQDLLDLFIEESEIYESIHHFGELLVNTRHPAFRKKTKHHWFDDFSLVVIDPYLLHRFGSRLLWGGTNVEIEAFYQNQCKLSTAEDQDIRLADRYTTLQVFPEEFPVALKAENSITKTGCAQLRQ
jgi:hypothetical protein